MGAANDKRTFKRPNVLLLYTDQQRWDSLGCYGNPHAITPNLGRLGAQGARFERFYVQSPVCTPSRMSMLTGRYCGSLGVGTNGVPFPDEALDETGLTGETIVVFTSDHGEFLGDHGRVQKGMPGFDCITRVPFLVSFPSEIKPAVVSEIFCEAVDLVPTILDYCGVQVPPTMLQKTSYPW